MSADTTLTCRDCGQAFTFTSGEQDFYASRGFSEPSRCTDCRAGEHFGIGAQYADYRAMLDRGDLDGVVLATSHTSVSVGRRASRREH